MRVMATEPLGPAVFSFVWHVSLLCVLLCVALIDFDGHTVPTALLGFGTALPLTMAWAWPAATSRLLHAADTLHMWEDIVAGAVLSTLITFAVKPSFRFGRRHRSDRCGVASLDPAGIVGDERTVPGARTRHRDAGADVAAVATAATDACQSPRRRSLVVVFGRPVLGGRRPARVVAAMRRSRVSVKPEGGRRLLSPIAKG